MIDLHIHSNASDGSCSPSEILSMALKLNLKAIAITDHDTIEGCKEILYREIPSSIHFLSGIEISASPPPEFPCSGSFHILGYRFRIDDPVLNQNLDILQHARRNRNPRIIQRLNELGIDISLQEVADIANGQIGRPHIANVLVKKRIAQTVNDAFDTFLGKGRPAYVDKFRISCQEAIGMILKAGGIPVLAHPGLLKPSYGEPVETLVRLLTDMGLKGIEVYYPEHSERDMANYAAIARRYGLTETGGTDFHGSIKPDIQLGTGKGSMAIPWRIYERLINS